MPTAPLPFDLIEPRHGPLGRWTRRGVARLLSLPAFHRLYRQTVERADGGDFLAAGLAELDVAAELDPRDLGRIPRSGGLVVVANHPFGIIEGVMLQQLVSRRRSDVRLLVNGMLAAVPEMREHCFFVDNISGPAAMAGNATALRASLRHLRGGGALIVFPAGEVAHWSLAHKRVVDPPWQRNIARLIRRSGAAVVPCHIDGRNSSLFHVGGLVHRRIRTLLLIRELLRQRGHRIPVVLGSAIPAQRLADLADDDTCLRYLRQRTMLLGLRRRDHVPATPEDQRPLRPPVSPGDLERDIEALPASARLIGGRWPVFCAEAAQIPHILQEIGRLRELSFRAVGEGTGRSCDLDRFDSHYLHLFIWNPADREIVGSYRLGRTDLLPDEPGLYTHTLFAMKEPLCRLLTPGLELGRSFVRPEHQRAVSPLLLLWKAIAAFVSREPRYRLLFGPVSISDDYQPVSKQLILEFLKARHLYRYWSDYVRERHPFRAAVDLERFGHPGGAQLQDLDELSHTIADLEPDGKGVGVLLRQYLRLGARFLGFNVDPDFNNAIDGLLVVDLSATQPQVLARFMGETESRDFLAWHRDSRRRSAPGDAAALHAEG